MVDSMTYLPNLGQISIGNSTTAPLGSSATFTGAGEQNDFPQVGVSMKTDSDCTLFFEFSNDGTNWDSTFPVSGFKVSANIGEFHTAVKLGRYFRIRIVNGADAQTFMRASVYYGDSFVPSSAPLNQAASLDQDAIYTRGTIAQDEIRIGRRAGVTGFTKFAYRDSLTAAAGEQVVWTDSSNTFTPMEAADTYNIAYDGTAGGSTDGAGTTGALTLAITHVNSDGNPETFVHTLGTDGTDTTTQSGFGINRVAVSSNGGSMGNVSDITVAATTSGDTQAHIAAGNSVSQQAIFIVGANHDAVARWLWIQINKLSGGGDVRATVRGYVYNRSIDTQFLIFRSLIDTRSKPDIDITDPIGFNLSPTDVIWFTIDSDTNNSEIDLRFSLNEYQRT